MTSNYRKLGEFIKEIDERNVEDHQENLLGLSVSKCFIPSIANTVGADFKKYKIVERGQFAYIPDTSRRGDKIAIALLSDREYGLISNVYTVFEVTSDELIPEYLELWFKRPEFDRYARFKSHGSVREVFDWEQLRDIEIPVPSKKEQRLIVNQHEVIASRIGLLQQLNDNLAALGVSIVSGLTEGISLIGINESDVASVEIPNNCKVMTVSEMCDFTKSGSTPSRNNSEYWIDGCIPWLKSGEVDNNVTVVTEELITESAVNNTPTKLLPQGTVLMAMYGVTAGKVGYLNIESCTNQAICGMYCTNKALAAFLYFSLIRDQNEISRLANGGAQNNLSKELIDDTYLLVPTLETIENSQLEGILNYIIMNYEELNVLKRFETILLGSLGS